ncbi:MAG: ThiF family adenylyltransferase [Candidatus Pacearchaeota archaeon]
MNVPQIHIVGAGGIGSYFCRSLYDAITQRQLDPSTKINVYDPDEVETKNTRYQCFDDLDIASLKVNVMEEKYQFRPWAKLVTANDIKLWNKNDIVISCVDNREFRKELFEICSAPETPYFIDLRCEGRTICYFTKSKHNTKEKLMQSLGSEDNISSGSCQVPYRFANSIIDFGNRIIAEIGLQLLVNYLREETFNSHLTLHI